MASGISVIVKALNIKGMHVDRVEIKEETVSAFGEEYVRQRIDVHARPYKNIRGRCPICRKKRNGYDHQAHRESSWRANSLNGVPVHILYKPARIECPEHGVLTEHMPWIDGRSRFTEGFNNEVSFLAMTCPKTVVSQYMGINWRTVGNCIKAAHDRLEPDVSERLRGLKRICVDETSYRKGYKYITVVYDLDRNRVVWVHENHGYEVFKQFCEALSKEECEAIEVVAGDGARWIDQCQKEYFRNARRCVDFFHVVGWINEALDKVRNQARSQANHEVTQMKKEFRKAEEEERKEKAEILQKIEEARKGLNRYPKRGRPCREKQEVLQYIEELEKQLKAGTEENLIVSEEEYQAAVEEMKTLPKKGRRSKRQIELMTIIAAYEGVDIKRRGKQLSAVHQKVIDDMSEKAKKLKGTKYALGMNPENLSESLQDKLRLIEESYPNVYHAYQMKEQLRIILHMKDLKTATIELDKWIEKAIQSNIKPFEELAEKIQRHRGNILNSIELQVNSSRSEATNTTIKSLIATARGFRNLDNMFALIYLRCSDIVVPLHNRYQPSAEKQKELRELQNMHKKLREEEKRMAALQ